MVKVSIFDVLLLVKIIRKKGFFDIFAILYKNARKITIDIG